MPADKSTFCLFLQDVIEARMALATLSAFERVGYATFSDAIVRFPRREFTVFSEAQQYFAIFVEHFSTISVQHLTDVFPRFSFLPCLSCHLRRSEQRRLSGWAPVLWCFSGLECTGPFTPPSRPRSKVRLSRTQRKFI